MRGRLGRRASDRSVGKSGVSFIVQIMVVVEAAVLMGWQCVSVEIFWPLF
jgi:hypothetical protein